MSRIKIMSSSNKLNKTLINPTKFKIEEITEKSISYYQTISSIYNMAYELLCQTIGEKKITAPIDIYAVAEKLGFRIFKEEVFREFLFNSINEIRKQNLGKLPYIELYDFREISPILELVIRKNPFDNTNFIDLTIPDYFGEMSIRYSIALAIAKVYFANDKDFEELCSNKMYNWGLNMLDTSKDLIERIFAYALLAPDKIMLERTIEYKNDNSRWPLDFSDLIVTYRDLTQMPEYHVVWMYQYWKDIQTYKYIQTLSKNSKTETSLIPKASLLNQFEADVYGLTFLEQTAKCSPLDYAVILGSITPSDYLGNYNYGYNFGLDSNESVCCYWLDAPMSENTAYAVDIGGNFKEFDTNIRNVAIRPKFIWSEISSFCVNIKKELSYVLEAEYGYWPSVVGDKEQQVELETLYKNDKLIIINLDYTRDYNELTDYEREFEEKKQLVYEHEGKKWIRTKITFGKNREKIQLSNGETYKSGDIVWVQLEPLKLLVDEKSDVAVAKNAIASGVRYKDLNKYLENYMSNELYHSSLLFQQEKIQEQSGPVLTKKLTPSRNTGNK